MSSPGIDESDQQMQQLFAALAPEVADLGFTDRAMGHIARRVWVRRVASAAALVIALPLVATVLGALLPAGVVVSSVDGSPGGSGWDGSVAVGFCLLLVLWFSVAVRD